MFCSAGHQLQVHTPLCVCARACAGNVGLGVCACVHVLLNTRVTSMWSPEEEGLGGAPGEQGSAGGPGS